MKIFSVIGHSGTGKTTLVTKLISHFTSLGYNVGSIKSIHRENFSLDKEGKDTYEHRKAGAEPVCALTGRDVSLIFNATLEFSRITELFNYLKKDLLIVEGMKDKDFPSIICSKEKEGGIEMAKGKDVICFSGLLSDKEKEIKGKPVISYTEVQKIASLVLEHLEE